MYEDRYIHNIFPKVFVLLLAVFILTAAAGRVSSLTRVVRLMTVRTRQVLTYYF